MEEDVVNALKAAGFEVIEAFNTHSELHSPEQIPW